jgi:hypothetical protein
VYQTAEGMYMRMPLIHGTDISGQEVSALQCLQGGSPNYLAAGSADGPLIIFVHGWPELSISWRHQLPCLGSGHSQPIDTISTCMR